jgi:hypothetical protein
MRDTRRDPLGLPGVSRTGTERAKTEELGRRLNQSHSTHSVQHPLPRARCRVCGGRIAPPSLAAVVERRGIGLHFPCGTRLAAALRAERRRAA